MNNLKRLFGFLLLAVVCSSLQAERISISMDQDWEFSLGELGADSVFIEQQDWRQLDLPHDWSIEGKYNKYHPSGRGGGYLPTGIAWYRKEFQLPAAYEGRRVFIEFDGVMANSEVYINGHLLGKRPNGYVSFSYDMSDHLRFGGNNQLSVRVNNSIQPASRWYTGSGINRHVRMVLKSPVHLPQWGVFVRSTKVSSAKAELNLQIDVKNDGDESTDVQVVSILRDDQGKEVRKSSTSLKALKAGESSRIDQNLSVQKPRLWSLEDPALYTLEVALYKAKELLDTEIVTTGIRSIRFDPAGGFFLNEKNTKMYGVCLHSDGGAVGTAVPLSLWEYRLEKLRELGVNAIRLAHNPVAPEFLDLCDRMGFLVMNESFDTWQAAKNHAEKGYNLYFKDWWYADTRDQVLRDRNHPSIVLFSVGNEIRDNLNNPDGFAKYKNQQDCVHKYDGSRPVTMALFRPNSSGVYQNGFADMMDVVGQNYRVEELVAYHEAHPEKAVIGTENIHDIASWLVLRDKPYMSGQFLWTGIDYLGEAFWPNVMYTISLLDITAEAKPQGLQRKSWWTTEPMVAMVRKSDNNGAGYWVSDWTPIDLDTYDQAEVELYSNCEEVEILLNGISQGRKTMDKNAAPAAYRLTFRPGECKVLGYNQGKKVAETSYYTAGSPDKIILTTNKQVLNNDWDEVAVVRATVVDEKGIPCTTADHLIQFEVQGAGRLVATGNANPQNHEMYVVPEKTAYQGSCIAIVRAKDNQGKITIRAKAEGIRGDAQLELNAAAGREKILTLNQVQRASQTQTKPTTEAELNNLTAGQQAAAGEKKLNNSAGLPVYKGEKLLLRGDKDGVAVFAYGAGDFGFFMPETAGYLKFGLVSEDKSLWLSDARKADIYPDSKGWRMDFQDPFPGTKNLRFEIRPLQHSNGLIIELKTTELPNNTSLVWTYGGCSGSNDPAERELFFRPEQCPDNVFSRENNAFTVYYGSSTRLRVMMGVAPVDTETRLADARSMDNPLMLWKSGKKTDAPVMVACNPLQANSTYYYCIYRQNSKSDYNAYLLPALFQQSDKNL